MNRNFENSVISGCQEGKATPRMVEFPCPDCGEILEGFARMGAIGTGTLKEDVECERCGRIVPEGSYYNQLK